MRIRTSVSMAVLLLLTVSGHVAAQQAKSWHDASSHSIQFVSVEDNVKLEVLDWGGTGRPLVLLAGLGGTAHVFDEFAPKLISQYHVYGVTRRGYGASSSPPTGYTADRLGDDVLAVLERLKLERPVLVGHSLAGEELSSVGSRHPERIAGLIYLDAAYAFAFYDSVRGDLDIDLNELRHLTDRLQAGNGDHKAISQELLTATLPAFERDLKQDQIDSQNEARIPVMPPPTAADMESFEAYHAYQEKMFGNASPEAQLRARFEETPDGHVGKERVRPGVRNAIIAGEQKYTQVRVPILAIFASPADLGRFADSDPQGRAISDAMDSALKDAQVAALKAVAPTAHVVVLAHANHAVFMSNEDDVLREMRAFITGLP